MARGVYTITGVNMTLKTTANPTTLLFLNPGTTCSLLVLRMGVSQMGTTTSTQFGLQVQTQTVGTAFPTVVSATPAKTAIIDQASAITGVSGACTAGHCGINASAEGTGSPTITPLFAYGPNNLNGWEWIATPPEQILLSAGGSSGLGIAMLTTWATLNTGWNVFLTYQEV